MNQRTHLLHLTDRQLGWLTVEPRGNVLRLGGAGSLAADPAAALDNWAREHARPGDSIRLYDGRQRYYSFVLRMPESARRSYVDAIALRIRQELGLDRSAVAWATRARPIPGEHELNELTTIVGRRDLLAEFAPWRDRHGLGSLWVGADIEAIAALARAALPGAPLVVVNADADAAALYAVSAEGVVVKAHLEDEDGEGGTLPPEIDPHGASLLVRGGGAAALLAVRIPALAAMHPLELFTSQNGYARALRLDGAEPEGLDAVLAGALRELTHPPKGRVRNGVGPVMGSLLEEPRGSQIAASAPLARLQERLSPARLAPTAVIALIALLCVATWIYRARAEALDRLSAHADSLRVPGEILRAQQSVLGQIKGERSSLLPLIQLMHEATPQGLNIRRIQLGAGGALRIEGTTQNRAQIVEFTKALTLSPLLARVQLLEDQAEPQNKFRFQLTADLIARKKP